MLPKGFVIRMMQHHNCVKVKMRGMRWNNSEEISNKLDLLIAIDWFMALLLSAIWYVTTTASTHVPRSTGGVGAVHEDIQRAHRWAPGNNSFAQAFYAIFLLGDFPSADELTNERNMFLFSAMENELKQRKTMHHWQICGNYFVFQFVSFSFLLLAFRITIAIAFIENGLKSHTSYAFRLIVHSFLFLGVLLSSSSFAS